MRGVATKTILAAVIAGASLLVTTVQASAHDYDRWDRWDRKHHWKHSHGFDRPTRVVERPVIVERPVVMAPARPMYVEPMVPAYGYGGGGGYRQDPNVNFNFSFPMR